MTRRSDKIILWRACGEGGRDREGRIPGLVLKVEVLWSPFGRNYLLRFAGVDRGRFKALEGAKRDAENNIAAWIAELREAEAEETRAAERVEEETAGRRLTAVVSSLANHGIPARQLGGIFLRLDAAEQLATKLAELQVIAERLREIEERGYV